MLRKRSITCVRRSCYSLFHRFARDHVHNESKNVSDGRGCCFGSPPGTRFASADPLGLPIGCQTYPVRKSISTDFAGTMKGLRAAGFTQIELCSPDGYDDFRASGNTSRRSCGAC